MMKLWLFVRKMGKFMKKKGYGARKRRDHNKEYVRRCYKCKSKDHVIADCPYTIVIMMRIRRRKKKGELGEERKEDDIQEEEEGWRLCGHLG